MISQLISACVNKQKYSQLSLIRPLWQLPFVLTLGMVLTSFTLSGSRIYLYKHSSPLVRSTNVREVFSDVR